MLVRVHPTAVTLESPTCSPCSAVGCFRCALRCACMITGRAAQGVAKECTPRKLSAAAPRRLSWRTLSSCLATVCSRVLSILCASGCTWSDQAFGCLQISMSVCVCLWLCLGPARPRQSPHSAGPTDILARSATFCTNFFSTCFHLCYYQFGPEEL